MKQKQTITLLTFTIALPVIIVAATGILTTAGPGNFEYETIRGSTVVIYGKGLYKHMSADVAIQGIAQDVVSLFIAIPLLLYSLFKYRKGSLRGHFLLTGVTGYFFVTYLFYTAMGMYNEMFLIYITILGLSFFLLFNLFDQLMPKCQKNNFDRQTPVKFAGSFMIFNSIAVGLMWLGVIIPPLMDGTVYPAETEHYTTLIVQGFDLGLLLPISFVTGVLLIKRKPLGYTAGVPYLIFLSILMTALTAKIIAMGLNGVNIIPAVFIIPAINVITILCSYLMVKHITEKTPEF